MIQQKGVNGYQSRNGEVGTHMRDGPKIKIMGVHVVGDTGWCISTSDIMDKIKCHGQK